MSFEEIVALQPAWVGYWLNWLLFGAFILPVSLVFWKQSRLAGIATVVCSVLAAAGVMWIFSELGYVKLMGLAHIVFWVPLVVYLVSQTKRNDMPRWPKRILWVVIVTLIVSLAFDFADVARYFLGEREPFTA